jgi:hypothetical protein
MMRIKRLIAIVSILIIFVVACYGIVVFFRSPTQSEELKKGDTAYFAILPITNWTNDRYPTPCLSIRIGEKTISSMFDLGFRGQFSIASEVLDLIQEKTYLGSSKMYGFNGKRFEKRVFEIPTIKIGAITVSRAIVQEEVQDYKSNSHINSENNELSQDEPGTIGWEVFEHLNLFIDLGNEKIVACDGIERLKSEGYTAELFSQTPLIYNRGFLEIKTETPNGPLQCVLDTGCTFNCLNVAAPEGQTKVDMENICYFPQFDIANKSFGPIQFLHIPIQLPIQVDAILGMEFFKDNAVFLDFTNKMAYFTPSNRKKDKG